MVFEKVLIVGAGRGLGRALALFCGSHLGGVQQVHLLSRKLPLLNETKSSMEKDDPLAGRRALQGATVFCVVADMTMDEGRNAAAALVDKEKFDLVLYVAGGGPHGEFYKKEWKDHLWSLNLGLITPMALVHQWLRVRDPQRAGQFIIVGSRVAEQSPDPMASSYAAGKHGLVGFVSSLQKELEQNQNKVRLFSPGYMDSELLPLTAIVRHDGSKLMSVDTAAQALLRWIKSEEGPWHRVLN